MQASYNGWSASTSAKDFGGLDNRAVAGVQMAPGVRAGSVATVLFYVAEQFHARVEKLVPGWCWGYSYRANRNAANLSCHASATAIDLNAPRHPNGKRGTFTAAQVAEIRRILTEVGKVVRWGGDFTGTPDEMHFEIVASPATVAMVADRLNPKGPAGSPITILPVQEDTSMSAADVANLTQFIDKGVIVRQVQTMDQLNTAVAKLASAQASLDLLIGVAGRPLEAEVRMTAKIEALSGVVQQLAAAQGTPVDMDAIEARVEKGVADAIASIQTTVSVKPAT